MQIKLVPFGVFVALALIFSYIEGLVSIQFGIPGAKLGLANLIIVIALYKIGWKEALVLAIVRVLLAGFIFANLFSIIYSMSGTLLSLFIMIGIKKSERFGLIGVSIAGGAAHNIGQLAVAMIVIESYSAAYYMPILLITGTLAGFMIGIMADAVLKRLVNIKLK